MLVAVKSKKEYNKGMEPCIWKKNLTFLQRRWPVMAHAVQELGPIPPLLGEKSRDGHWVWRLENGQAVHSLYHPTQESRHFCNTCTAQVVLFIGFGCGYHILPFLAENRFTKILIIEPCLAELKAVLSTIEQEKILSDPRVELACLPQASDFFSWIMQHYRPLWHGTLVHYTLRPIFERHRPYCEAILAQLSCCLRVLSGDLSSQAFFAPTWFRNIITNLWFMQKTNPWMPCRAAKVWLAGAGPSLDKGLPILAQAHARGDQIIACDAALRPLLHAHITPDVVVSLDAQAGIAKHFVGITKPCTVLCDIASPPSVARVVGARFFAGGHPLAQLSRLTPLDTHGGHVGYAVLALAKRMADNIAGFFGFDFCFPQMQVYARAVYVYPEFALMASRLNPYTHQTLGLVFRYHNLTCQADAQGAITYTPDLFRGYGQSFQSLWSAPVCHASCGFQQVDGRAFVLAYKKNILHLTPFAWQQDDTHTHDLCVTLAPLVAYFIAKKLTIAQAWAQAIDWAKNFLNKIESA